MLLAIIRKNTLEKKIKGNIRQDKTWKNVNIRVYGAKRDEGIKFSYYIFRNQCAGKARLGSKDWCEKQYWYRYQWLGTMILDDRLIIARLNGYRMCECELPDGGQLNWSNEKIRRKPNHLIKPMFSSIKLYSQRVYLVLENLTNDLRLFRFWFVIGKYDLTKHINIQSTSQKSGWFNEIN